MIDEIFDYHSLLTILKVLFTVVVASKRHHLRFFPKEGDTQAGDRNGNSLPGTLVEYDITHPFEYDFCEYHCLTCSERVADIEQTCALIQQSKALLALLITMCSWMRRIYKPIYSRYAYKTAFMHLNTNHF